MMADDDRPKNFQRILTRTRIAPDLQSAMPPRPSQASGKLKPMTGSGRGRSKPAPRLEVIIEFNDRYPAGCQAARDLVILGYSSWSKIEPPPAVLASRRIGVAPEASAVQLAASKLFQKGDKLSLQNSLYTRNYLFGSLSSQTIDELAELAQEFAVKQENPSDPGEDQEPETQKIPLVYKIWADHKLRPLVYRSANTIKCDAAKTTFAAAGKGIVWAVADTGIDGGHPHFKSHATLDLGSSLLHCDFTQEYADPIAANAAALVDTDGHGTHVAGVIAGETKVDVGGVIISREILAGDTPKPDIEKREEPICGLAPMCKILSLKILNTRNDGDDSRSLSRLLAAIGYLQIQNDHGKDLRVHGLNLSVGYSFDPEWFAAGQSPLCVEVNRLVRSGMVVVVAAGNAGYGAVTSYSSGAQYAVHGGTINDPGNAELAITVGSTHRESPHSFGVSFFSAKGPTADGRMKPDLVAPGEHIVSCALYDAASKAAKRAPYREESGTSMAAPHVSGAAAVFLSVRQEFKGQPDKLKEILLSSATDLKRLPEFQGAGLIDIFRALQSV